MMKPKMEVLPSKVSILQTIRGHELRSLGDKVYVLHNYKEPVAVLMSYEKFRECQKFMDKAVEEIQKAAV